MNAINSYKTEGTNAGDWYLPAAGELHLIKNYYFEIFGGYKLLSGSGLSTNWYVASSNEIGAYLIEGNFRIYSSSSEYNPQTDVSFRTRTQRKESGITIYPFIKY